MSYKLSMLNDGHVKVFPYIDIGKRYTHTRFHGSFFSKIDLDYITKTYKYKDIRKSLYFRSKRRSVEIIPISNHTIPHNKSSLEGISDYYGIPLHDYANKLGWRTNI